MAIDVIERLKGAEVRIEDIERWQQMQNGAIRRIEDDIKDMKKTQLSMVWGIALSAFGAIGSFGVGVVLYLMSR